jgi:purine nucleosidase
MIFLPLVLATAFVQQKIIFDTDIGDDIDDAYALGLLLRIPNVKLLGVTTAFGDTVGRSKVAAKLLREFERNDVPVFAGRFGNIERRSQFGWAKDFTAKSLKSEPAVEFMKREIERSPRQITIIAVGPLTNVGDLIAKYPDVKAKIKQVVIMGGSFHVGYNNQPPINAEWNIHCDPAAARLLFHSGIPVVCAGLEVTTMMQFDATMQQRLSDTKAKGTSAIAELKTRLPGPPVLNLAKKSQFISTSTIKA